MKKNISSIKPQDLAISVYRHPTNTDVNQGSNCIRITHVPTGIIVKSEERGGYNHNRDMAMKLLEIELEARQQDMDQRDE